MSFAFFLRIILSTAVLIALSGCGKDGPASSPDHEVYEAIPRADKESLANSFPLVDARSGRLQPPRTPQGGMPFGVLLSFINHTKLGMCTVSHWRAGTLLTNAHCLEGIPDVSAFYVVFIDQANRHRFAEVTQLGYVGDQNADDVAVLKVSEPDVSDWDALNPLLVDTSPYLNKPLGQGGFPVTLWSFDPASSHPELAAEFIDGRGGVFVPKNCTGFRTTPRAALVHYNGDREDLADVPVNVNTHVLVDRCDRNPMPGNSGSWISASDDPSRGYGLFHWLITLGNLSPDQEIKSFEYTGSDGRQRRVPARNNFSFFFVGTDLFKVLNTHPGAF